MTFSYGKKDAVRLMTDVFNLYYSSDIKSKMAKSEEVPADSSQQVTSGALTDVGAYDPSYSSAAAYTAAASAYSYATPQSQWAAYSAAHPVRSYTE